MSHLTDIEIVDLIDGTLRADRQRHVDGCEACRAQAEGLRSALLRASYAEIPEPSPLFWMHLSQRVKETVAEQAIDRGGWFAWLRQGRVWPAAAALATFVLVVGIWGAMPTPGDRPIAPAAPMAASPSTATVSVGNDADIDDDIDADEAWALVRTVADDVPWDQTHDAGISARPGAAERIALQLTPAERKELARLLEDELRRNGA